MPKKKLTVDPGAIRALKKWVELGSLVGVYPEGERSWDGELLPLLPGIEALVRLLKVPVIPLRILNADRVMPRWALGRRYGPVKLVFGEPRSFERKTPPALIRAWLERELRVDPHDERNHAPVRGRRLALGLDNPLFRCPHCFAWDALVPSGDEIRCRECTATWRVDTRNCLIGRHGGARSMTIIEARAAIRARNLRSFIVDERRFEREGVIASSEPMRLLDVSGDEAISLGHGRMVLSAESLDVHVHGGAPLLQLPLADLIAVTIDLQRRLIFRTRRDRVLEAVLPRESPLKWAELVNHWRQARNLA